MEWWANSIVYLIKLSIIMKLTIIIQVLITWGTSSDTWVWAIRILSHSPVDTLWLVLFCEVCFHIENNFSVLVPTIMRMTVAQGRCHKERSGFEGAWTSNPLFFDNSYFKYVILFAKPFPSIRMLYISRVRNWRLRRDCNLCFGNYWWIFL